MQATTISINNSNVTQFTGVKRRFLLPIRIANTPMTETPMQPVLVTDSPIQSLSEPKRKYIQAIAKITYPITRKSPLDNCGSLTLENICRWKAFHIINSFHLVFISLYL